MRPDALAGYCFTVLPRNMLYVIVFCCISVFLYLGDQALTVPGPICPGAFPFCRRCCSWISSMCSTCSLARAIERDLLQFRFVRRPSGLDGWCGRKLLMAASLRFNEISIWIAPAAALAQRGNARRGGEGTVIQTVPVGCDVRRRQEAARTSSRAVVACGRIEREGLPVPAVGRPMIFK
jgi:hypothetical protein